MLSVVAVVEFATVDVFLLYVYELMKVWFGTEYEQAKTIHDKYLSYALKDQTGAKDYYLINGRQVSLVGGRGDSSGTVFGMDIWVKDALTKDTMYKD